jgi:hypothetical protein
MRWHSHVGWVLTATVACSRAGNSGDAAQAPAGLSELRGKVVITGTEPATSVRLVMNEGNVELVGSLEPELRRLAAAGLIVRGSLQGRHPVRRLEVKSYEVTDIDGAAPSVGVLQLRDDKLWLAGSDTLQLVEAPETLQTKEGAKVWIVGRRSSGTLEVQSYGIIRE